MSFLVLRGGAIMKRKGIITLFFQLNYEGDQYKGWAEFITYVYILGRRM